MKVVDGDGGDSHHDLHTRPFTGHRKKQAVPITTYGPHMQRLPHPKFNPLKTQPRPLRQNQHPHRVRTHPQLGHQLNHPPHVHIVHPLLRTLHQTRPVPDPSLPQLPRACLCAFPQYPSGSPGFTRFRMFTLNKSFSVWFLGRNPITLAQLLHMWATRTSNDVCDDILHTPFRALIRLSLNTMQVGLSLLVTQCKFPTRLRTPRSPGSRGFVFFGG